MLKKSAFTTLTMLSLTCLSSLSHAMEVQFETEDTQTPYARVGSASDLANGLIPEDKKSGFEEYQKEILSKVRAKIDRYELTYAQIISYFMTTVINDDDQENSDNALKVTRAIGSFLKKQTQRNEDKFLLIDGQIKEGIKTEQTRKEMARANQYGRHAALVREGKQKEADIYALIRYFAYKNMYDAIPNPDDGESKEDNFIPAIIPGQEALVEKMIQTAVSDVAPKAIQNYMNANLNLVRGVAARAENTSFIEFLKRGYYTVPQDSVSNVNMRYSRQELKAFDQGSVLAEKKTPISFWNEDKVQNAHSFFSDPIFEEIVTLLSKTEDYRPHAFLKKQADKWLARIDPKTSPLVKELALDAAFFNPDLSEAGKKKLLSAIEDTDQIAAVSDSSPKGSDSIDLDKKIENIRVLLDQVSLKFFPIFMSENFSEPLKNRLQSIFDFLKGKEARMVAKKESDGKEKSNQEERDAYQETAHAFTKYISYKQLQFALTHDSKGQILSIFAPEVSSESSLSLSTLSQSLFGTSGLLTNSFIGMTYSLDDFFHKKAQKWEQKVVSSKSSFIKDNALNAFMFR